MFVNLIGISPAGAVVCLSEGWGGRVSDGQITLESRFLSKLNASDFVLADRGFHKFFNLSIGLWP